MTIPGAPRPSNPSRRSPMLLRAVLFLAACHPENSGGGLVPERSLARVVVTPESASVPVGDTQQFAAVGELLDGTTVAAPVTWTATGGTISASGLFSASDEPGDYRIIATQQGGTLADTCNLVIAAARTSVTAVVLNPNLVSLQRGASQQFSVTGRLSNGTTGSVAVTYRATGGSITSGGLYTAGDVTGSFRVIATQQNGTLADTSVVNIVVPTPILVGVTISPTSVGLQSGTTQQFAATGWMSDGSTANVAVSFSATGGAISAGGLYTAGSTPGTFRVIASTAGGTMADTSTVTIATPPPSLVAVVITPASVNLQTGAAQQFSATGSMSNGSTAVVAVSYSATGGTITPAGLYTAGSNAGTFRVIASLQAGTLADTSTVIITSAPPPPITGIVLTPSAVSLQSGAAQQFTAIGQRADGSSAGVAVTYTATGGVITAGGLFTAGNNTGVFRVIATQQGGTFADTSAVTITPPPLTLTAVVLTPASVNLPSGATQQFSATGLLSNGAGTGIAVSYAATGGTISASGLYTAGIAAGTFRVIATLQGGALADTSTITVSVPPPSLVSVVLTPSSVSLQSGTTQQFSATGKLSNGNSTSITVTYSATGGTISAAGLYTAGNTAGTFRAISTQVGGTLADTSAITITSPPPPPPPPPTLTQLVVSPASVSLASGATQQFVVSGTWSDGSITTPSASYSATGGTISASGLYTAGSSAGSFRVIATHQGGTKADTSAITITPPAPPTLTQLVLSPAAVSLATGATQQFSVTGTWSDASTTTPSAVYTATGGIISASGLFTAGSSAGTFRVIATHQGGTKADSSTVSITAPPPPPPPTLTQLILSPATVSLTTGTTQQFAVTGVWSDGSTTPPAASYVATGGTISASGLYTAGGTAGSYTVIATHIGGTRKDTASVTITASAGGGFDLFSEGFETANIGARGWFDAATVAIAADARPGSTGTRALQWHWNAGTTAPQGSSRIDFAPSTSVYLSYWIKQSTNWVGSGRLYHPHMFHFLTTADDRYIGPSRTHLTLYDELLYVPAQGGSVPLLSIQDALMIDPTKLMVDLTNVTEQRSIGGYNGRPETSTAGGNISWDAFDYGGGSYTNYKFIKPSTVVMTNATKNSWHHVESYWQMNSIVGGKGQRDGIVQYWFDGALLVDRRDIYFRTGVNASMQFRTFVMAPYIGDGSPVAQDMWIDDLTVRTRRP